MELRDERRLRLRNAVRSDFIRGDGSIYVIADAGSNHAGELARAKRLIEVSAEAGADAVKFQLFKWPDVAKYPETCDPRFELPEAWIPELAGYANDRGLHFLCTCFAAWSISVVQPYVSAWKVGSFEATKDFISRHDPRKPLLVSLGMVLDSRLDEMLLEFPNAIFLHCVSKYPTALENSSLGRIRYPIIGFSDHTEDDRAALVALGRGAKVFEKHIQCQDQPETPDKGSWALPPIVFKMYVDSLRRGALALKGGEFERATVPMGRRSHG